MLGKYRKKWAAIACSLLTALSLGMPAVALAEDGDIEAKSVSEAHLTKVLNAPIGDSGHTYAENDEFTFTFTAIKGRENPAVVAVEDCPVIKPLVLRGVDMEIGTVENPGSALDGGTFGQSVSSATFAYILGMEGAEPPYPDAQPVSERTVTFPHAGEYTYQVVESGSSVKIDYTSIDSKASYIVRIIVKNGDDGKLVPSLVLADSEKDDFGKDRTGKVDVSLPELSDTKDTIKTDDNKAVGEQGCNVPGLTFANQYISGGNFVIEKIVEGDYGDKTKWYEYELIITDDMALPDSAITYTISSSKGEMISEDSGMLDNVMSEGPYNCFKFGEDQHELHIKFKLKDGGKFTINGVWGTVASEPIEGQGTDETPDYRKKWATGLNANTEFTLIEKGETNYTAKAYVYGKANVTPPTFDGNKDTTVDPEDIDTETGNKNEGVSITSKAGTDGTHVFVVNKFDDSAVSLTGIFINNLPYILMIGVPLVVFAVMFARRRRASATAA